MVVATVSLFIPRSLFCYFFKNRGKTEIVHNIIHQLFSLALDWYDGSRDARILPNFLFYSQTFTIVRTAKNI